MSPPRQIVGLHYEIHEVGGEPPEGKPLAVKHKIVKMLDLR